MVLIRTVLTIFIASIFEVDGAQKPNIIIFLTDDQDILLDSMVALKNVRRLINDEGITFQNAFVNSPICCPSRSTILTGKHLHNIMVTNNSLAGNCSSPEWQKNFEPQSFVSLLKNKANYTTFYAGKYLNRYGDKDCGGAGHVPVGYDWWLGLHGNSRYYNYTLSVNGTAKHFTDEYLTDVMKQYALSFLNRKQTLTDPFFMMLSTPAAHAPFTPAPRHAKKFPGMKALRTPSFNYSDTNRHWLLRLPPRYLPLDISLLDDIQRHRMQTLLAVDEMVGEIVGQLQRLGVTNNTYILFTSDNGFHIGQFVQPWDKRQPYETDIKVPLSMRGPLIAPNQTSQLAVASVDLAPTILSIAGVDIPQDMDGVSFYKAALKNSDLRERNILIEYYGEGDSETVDASCFNREDGEQLSNCVQSNWCKCEDARNNTYACVRTVSATTDFKFCQFYDTENFIEAYNLRSDPYELHNIYIEMKPQQQDNYSATLKQLLRCTGLECRSLSKDVMKSGTIVTNVSS